MRSLANYRGVTTECTPSESCVRTFARDSSEMHARARHSRAAFAAAPRSTMLLLAICLALMAKTYAYDYASSCTRSFRSSRSHSIIKKIPCDLRKESYCALPGATYPWHAVRRFVHENQGLMRRMYGDQRHISVLQAEIDTNDIDDENTELDSEEELRKASALAEDIMKTKLLYANKPEGRSVDMKTVPHFRPVQTTSSPIRDTELKSNNSTKQEHLVNKNKTKIFNQSNSDNIQNETSDEDNLHDYDKGMLYQDGIKGAKPQTTTKADVNNNVEPEVITLEAIIKQTIESNSVYPKYDTGQTSISNKTKLPLASNVESSPKITSLLDTLSETSTKSSRNEDTSTTEKEIWKPLSVDTPTLPPTLFFSEHEKLNKNDRVDSDVGLDDDQEKPATEDSQAKPTNVPVHQESVRPTVLKLRGVNACPVKEEVVAPFWANNTRGEVLALLNLYPFEQYVHWEKCTNEHKQMYCRDGCRCEQQYRLHRLLAYDPNNECRGIFSDWFRFPSCCVCKCYDVPLEYRTTSRSPRVHAPEPDEGIQRALYESAAEDWYTMANYDDVEDFEE